MKKTMISCLHLFAVTALAVSLCASPACGLITSLADAADYEMVPGTAVDYDVKVSAPDGGVNMRYGPGTDRAILVSMIPNGTFLHVTQEATATNGKKWGFTYYDGMYGWISLTQVKKAEVATTKAPLSTEDYTGGTPADYQVQVSASDGGVNMRYGPGTGYEIKRSMIPNTVILDITAEVKATNGKFWGYTYYDGVYGWVALSQTAAITPDPAAEIGVPATAPSLTQSAAPEDVTGRDSLVDDPFPESAAGSSLSAGTDSAASTDSQPTAQPAPSSSGSTVLIAVLAAACVALAVAVVAVLVILSRNKKQP